MYTNDKLFGQIFAGKRAFDNNGEPVVIEQKELGELFLPTGRLVACDPFLFSDGIPFEKTISKGGSFPVSVFVCRYKHGDQRIALAMIQFQPQLPETFEPAFLQQVEQPDEEGDYGYCVDSGTGCFMDKETLERMEALGLDLHFQVLEEALSESYAPTYSIANVSLTADSHNLVAFSTGWGDGAYPSFWGLKDGEICCLITDFLIVDA